MGEREAPDSGPLVSFVVATYNRPDDLAEAIQSILDQRYRPIEIHVVSNATDRTAAMFAEGERFDDDCITYHEFPGRMGVPEARNVGYERATGNILVTLDDDAALLNDDATGEIVRLFDEHGDVGILAFQCRDHETGRVNPHETPDPPTLDTSPRHTYRATNFVGVGNAIRQSVLEESGGLPDNFIYGFEEMDLSLRAHDAGYDVLYTPTVVVSHKKSASGRRPDTETLERLAENRIRIAIRNLPLRYVFVTTLLWTAYCLLTTRNTGSLENVFSRLVADRRDLLAARSVVDPGVISRIKARQTMLFWWWYGPHPRRILGRHGNLNRLRWEISGAG